MADVEIGRIDGNGITELTLSGELDMSSSPRLRSVLLDVVDRRVGELVIHLDNVSYIDSSGLATLVECLQGMKRNHARLRLTGMNAKVRAVFELSRLDRVFEIHD